MVFGIICVIQAVCLYMSNVHIMDQNGPWIFIRDVLISVLNIFLLLCSFFLLLPHQQREDWFYLFIARLNYAINPLFPFEKGKNDLIKKSEWLSKSYDLSKKSFAVFSSDHMIPKPTNIYSYETYHFSWDIL